MKKYIFAVAIILTIVFSAVVACFYFPKHKMSVNTDTSKQADISDNSKVMSRADRKLISDLIKQTIQDVLDGKKIKYPDLRNYPAKWSANKVVYTTLNIGNILRGCQGNFNAPKPLLYAIIDAAHNAAFNDPRFPKLTQQEFDNPDFNFYITILSEPKPLLFRTEQDIVHKLKPFQHGLYLTYEDGNNIKKRGLFLPSVWKKNPAPWQFWLRLKKKAHIRENFFSDQFKVYYLPAETIRDFKFMTKQDEKRIQKALSAFKKLFQPDGHITYKIDFGKGISSAKNNIVREMGSGYGLAYAYYVTHDASLQPLIKNFLKYAQSATVSYQNGKLIADNPHKISSGATALALLAVLYYEQETKSDDFETFRTDLKNALISLFNPDIGVYRSPYDKTISPYYDGETWLALTMYNIFHPKDEAVSNLIPQLNKTMYDKYSDTYLGNFFHWGTQAAAHQYAHSQDPLMYDYLKKQLNIYIDNIMFHPNSGSCSYVEGLSEAALALQNKDRELYNKILLRLENQLDTVRLLQEIPFKEDARGQVIYEMKPLLGLFLNDYRSLITRSDATQHCLSALFKAQIVFNDAP